LAARVVSAWSSSAKAIGLWEVDAFMLVLVMGSLW
jgi:hypothetical protein